MEVYEFSKTYEERYHEIQRVFHGAGKPLPTSRVRVEWLIFLEKFFDVAEWQGLWKIPRYRCERLNINYPFHLPGTVTSVDFTTGIAEFITNDDDFEDSEMFQKQYKVPIEQLWVGVEQKDQQFKADEAAEAVDAFRYFLTYIWLPWDIEEDDGQDYFSKYVLMRLQMLCDMKTGKIRRSTAAHIRELLVETHRLSEIREIVQEEEPSEEIPNKLDVLVKINAQINLLRSKLAMLQDGNLREIYEDSHLEILENYKSVIVTESNNKLSEILKLVSNIDSTRFCFSLQKALMTSNASDKIHIGSGKHVISFREYFNSQGSICGVKRLENVPQMTLSDCKNTLVPVICSELQDHFLIICNGEFTFENIVFDCTNVKYGFVCQDQAKLTLKNCVIRGSTKLRSGSVTLNNCLIVDCFYGIGMKSGTTVDLIATDIVRCEYGIFLEEDCDVTLEDSNFKSCTNYGIYLERFKSDVEIEEKEFNEISQLQSLPGFQITGNCSGTALIEIESMDVEVIDDGDD
uniref:Uncharacterized protein n=1 Tax=Phlebotomus papatasi TaxID=29031 RepID=A0A1B0D6Z6_PHLPP